MYALDAGDSKCRDGRCGHGRCGHDGQRLSVRGYRGTDTGIVNDRILDRDEYQAMRLPHQGEELL